MSRPLNILFARETLMQGGPELSTNHLAREMGVLGHGVYWMTRPLTPISPLGSGGRSTLSRRWRVWRENWSKRPGPQICLFSGLARKRQVGLKGRWLLRNIYRATLPSVSSALNRRGLDGVDVLWLSDPIQTGLRRKIPHRRLVFQVTDDYSQFDNYGTDVHAELRETLQQCDAVLFTNDDLRDLYAYRFRLAPNRCHYVSHGMEPAQISGEIDLTDRVRAVFVGNINEWIDWDWLEELARRVPRLRITFYGQLAKGCADRMEHAAFTYRGYLDRSKFAEILPRYHFGLIPFQRIRLKRFSEPMKLYDYVSCGLPIVSSIDVHERFEKAFPVGLKIVAQAAQAAEFLDAAAQSYGPLRRDHAEDCRRFAVENTWARRAIEALSLIGEPAPIRSDGREI